MEDRKIRLFISVFFSMLIIVLLCCSTHSNLFVVNTCCLWGLSWIYLAVCFYHLTFGYCLRTLFANGMVKAILHKSISLVICVIIIVAFPIKYGDVLTQNYHEKMMFTNNEIRIIPLQNANEKSTAAEVWIDKVLVNYKEMSLEPPEGWKILDGHIYASDAKAAQPLIINVPKGSYYQVSFIKTEASGMVEYCIGDNSQIVDLYSENRESVNVEPGAMWGSVLSAPAGERIIYYGAYFLLMWTLIDTMWICVYERLIKRNESDDLYKKDVEK